MEACWQCHNNHVATCLAGKTTLSINIDETYVQFYQGLYKGNVAVRTEDLPTDTPPLQQHATRSELRQGLTHVGVICDSAFLQPLLPQILIAPKNVLRVGDLAACRAAMPEPIYVVHKKKQVGQYCDPCLVDADDSLEFATCSITISDPYYARCIGCAFW